ncbi:MAG: hypothetical protein SYC29_06645 [Planctomycetota bacterium]|nr:hypothetical protein [Planctomycetota bacterium]
MSASTLSSALGVLFSRLLVPGWLMTGALFKLYYRSPRSLPETIWKNAYEIIDLDLLLRGIIGLELVIAGIMFFSRRFARPTAIALLVVFCLILLNEMRIGAASCGCMGKIVMPPWVMLVIDVPLLIGVLVFRPSGGRPPEVRSTASAEGKPAMNPWPAVFALAWVLFSFGLAFGVPDVKVQQPDDTVAVRPNPGNGDPAANPGDNADTGDDQGRDGDPDESKPGEEGNDDPPDPGEVVEGPEPPPPSTPRGPQPPPSWHVFEVDEYAGKRWNEIPFTRFLRTQPEDINSGRRYIVLYNPTCDHCYDVLLTYFTGELPAPTTVIAIPETKTGWSEEEAYPMPCEACARLELPLGCDWLVLPPVVIALEDGVVQCAKEGEDPIEPECLIWH